jgi:putative ABC transport system substrate-binding protein
VTGVSYMQGELAAKQVGLLHELLPEATRFAVLANPNNPLVNDSIVTDSRAAVSSIGAHIEVLSASSNSEIDAAFANLTGQRCQALLVSPGPLFGNRRIHMYYDREFTEIGGLISYGTSLVDQYRQTGIYTGRVLRGERPTDLPVQRATKFELVINVQTAKTLGLTIPPTLLARADEVIE